MNANKLAHIFMTWDLELSIFEDEYHLMWLFGLESNAYYFLSQQE